MTFRHLTIAVALVVVALTNASAQARQTEVVPPNVDAIAIFLHDGQNVAGYRVYLDGVQVGTDSPATARDAQTGEIKMALGKLARGTYTVEASAFNVDGESKSPPVQVDTRGVPPNAPGAPRVVTVTVIVSVP